MSLQWRRLATIFGLLVVAFISHAQPGLPTGSQIGSWSFMDTNWLDDSGNPPIAFTNIVNATNAGDGNALLIDSTNTAFLQYYVWEPPDSRWTNLIVTQGSVTMWIAPNWSSTNQGGTGPGEYSRLIEVGAFTTNANIGWWSLYLSPDGSTMYFGAQTNSGSTTTFLSAPVSFVSNTWYNIALSYSPTNTTLYTNAVAITNGSGVTLYPGSDVLSNGFFVGSASDGTAQFHGMIDDLWTYDYAMGSNDVARAFTVYSIAYYSSPATNFSQDNFTNAPAAPSGPPAPDWFTGPGFLQFVSTNTSNCVTSSSIWITNVVCSPTNSQGMNVTFTIAGGSDGVRYDVFGTAALTLAGTNAQWAWLGQGYHCSTYTMTIQSNSAAFFALGKPQDTDGDGLTDAYELLVSKTNPNSTNSFGSLPDAWVALNGLTGNSNIASQDPDQDGLNNMQEYLYGTKPLTSEGFTIWVGNPAGVSGVP